MKIIGGFIWPEMRMIVNLFDVANKSYKTDTVGDIFTEQGQRDELSSNPSRAMPQVLMNNMKILADPATLTKHICRTYKMEQLYPLAEN